MYRPNHHHHKTVFRIALATIAALAAGGCGQGDEPAAGQSPADSGSSVMFGAYISGAIESRASVADIKRLKQTGFGVFASSTGDLDFNPGADGGCTSDFMCNQKVEWSSVNADWFYEPEQEWSGSKISFFAYAPWTDTSATGTTGITGLTGADAGGSPKLTFRMDSDVDRQTDLLYADTGNTLNLIRSKQVQLKFRHALSRVSFKCAADGTVADNTTVTIKSVTLSSSGLGVSGTLDLCTGAWENVETSEMEYKLDTDDFASGSNVITKAGGTGASTLTADGKYLMIIPSGKAAPVKITVVYDVVTTDAGLAAGSISISNETTVSSDLKLEAGKAYCLTLRLGMKSVVIDAGISDWDDYDSDWKPKVEKTS